MDNYMLVPFYGELYVFYFMSAIICIWILYVLSHDVSNALLHHVTPNYSRKADSQFNHKTPQLWRDVMFVST